MSFLKCDNVTISNVLMINSYLFMILCRNGWIQQTAKGIYKKMWNWKKRGGIEDEKSKAR